MDEEAKEPTDTLGDYLGLLGPAILALSESVETLARQPDEETRERVAQRMARLQERTKDVVKGIRRKPELPQH